MNTNSIDIQDVRLYRYPIASEDMKYIEVNQRDIYLRRDPQGDMVLQGEIPGCGDSCDADLAQVILEFVMTCEGCDDPDEVHATAQGFGKALGSALASHVKAGAPGEGIRGWVDAALTCVVRSVKVPYTSEHEAGDWVFMLNHCPLRDAAGRTGIGGRMEAAHAALYALYEGVAEALNPNMRVRLPSASHDEGVPLELEFSLPN